MLSVFGIRHHGPGSAKSLLHALEQLQPDCILMEGPQDAEKALSYVADPDLTPPVAMLIYNPKNLKRASYLPFASFSPEWQAAKYAFRQNIPIKLIDLPMGIHFALRKADEERVQIQLLEEEPLVADNPLIRDPLGYMAKLAGYTDSERWWEVTFEQQENDSIIFESILEMMRLLREAVKGQESPQTLLREAFMRKQIRAAVKEGFQNIAVVCGAWHAPIIKDFLQFKVSADNALLKGLKKIAVKATWIPWSYKRLALQSGYGAGVLSPAWYDLLFHHHEEVNSRWMIEAGRLLRAEDLDASAAHVLEGVRLADSLATIRERTIPGIEELEEAAIAVLCAGRTAPLELIRTKLIIGDILGKVPDRIPQIPLQQDLAQRIKSARLTKERNSTVAVEKKLDLRKNTNLAASHLLHRLLLLGINWGKELAVSENSQGSFHENWHLNWDPEFEIHIIEAGMWGNTVEEAATNFTIKQTAELEKINALTTLAGRVLKADLPNTIGPLIQRIQEVAALSSDTIHLMEALLPLVQIIRYGSSRKMNVTSLEQLVDQIIPRISIGLPAAATQLEEEQAKFLFEKLLDCNRAITLINKAKHQKSWLNALEQLAIRPAIQAILSGAALRILFDKNLWETKETADRMYYALSATHPMMVAGNSAGNTRLIEAAQWIEGFLHGSGLLLIYNPSLWMILDNWVDELESEAFKEIVPLLRRTFSQFPEGERQKMLDLAQKGITNSDATADELEPDKTRIDTILPTLQLLFDLPENG